MHLHTLARPGAVLSSGPKVEAITGHSDFETGNSNHLNFLATWIGANGASL